MALDSIIKRVFILDDLIRQGRTGSASDLSKTLGVSTRQVYNYISKFNKIGKTVKYDLEKNTFVYVEKYEKEEAGK
ncbi:HTH domain-containing protein [Fulvivirga sp. M361]|uniref:HTH domain-containing protein n=1 Tax=Fulvivirga sp. M361 TaxID=2594266 RepID=UPI00117A672F|nr:HTH domain-containing protein [Fulvivirga sp. M361]TRX61195.1 HTH domain-containing protein [Fulvivirga sp. M361]